MELRRRKAANTSFSASQLLSVFISSSPRRT